ncbi:MAG: hybrid sensor histidine kinase/response regulator [Prevotella sp.]|nr:hybrid sensor histidine kinase/response regulator [Prevotella sp.]
MGSGGVLESKINRSDYKILIVDDVVSNVLLLKILLTNEKFQICTASNGRECIEKTKSEHPDLILLDVMMPDLNGFDTAVILKNDPETANVPIIFLTALNTPSDLVQGFKVGASDFLTKPFNKEELIVRVMQQISLVAARRIIMEQNEELRHTISNRDKMYSVIAHDLRSPMASIRMVLNLFVSTVSPEMIGQELYDLIDKANRESEETHSLLDNLLKWTKSQTGRLNVVYQDFEINDVVLGVVDIFVIIAETKHIRLNCNLGTENLKVHADTDMLNTVIRNFLSNAIKFSNENSTIDITVARSGDFARISVRDHGVGISEDRIASLFSSGKTTYGTKNEEGSGLGLQLCKDFAVKNGGDVEVESVHGEGSTFSVLVPLVAAG